MFTIMTTPAFDDWFAQLKDHIVRFRIQARIDRMEGGNLGDCKPVGHGVSEARLDFGPGYRMYFMRREMELIVLLCGGDKSSQQKDIQAALRLAATLDKARLDEE